MKKVQTYWSFDPLYSEVEQARLEYIFNSVLSVWIAENYPAVAERLERNPIAKSAEQHEGAPTPLQLHGQQVWRCFCLNLTRTIGDECWICLGPQNFVENLYDRYYAAWEQWNVREGHTALGFRRIP